MNIDMYANYLLVVLILLFVLNYVVLYISWEHFSSKGIVAAICSLIAVNIIGMYSMAKIKVYNNKGIVQTFSQSLGDMIAITVLLVIITFVGLIAGSIVGYHIAGKVGISIPIIATGIFYGSLALVSKVLK